MTDAETPEPPVPETPKNRRPLTSRNTAWARGLTERAIKAGLTPNQISRLGIGFAALGMVFYTLSPYGPGILQWFFLILAAATCQARLVCNLIDGMVAVEGGQGAKDGPFWNEAPDRLSDFFFFIGAGLAAGNAALGTLAAALAIAAAYIRELGRAEGFPPISPAPWPNRSAWQS
jgi:phosphatidylglycerophosphate synthase